jgi:hypothetical protein
MFFILDRTAINPSLRLIHNLMHTQSLKQQHKKKLDDQVLDYTLDFLCFKMALAS